MEVPNLLPDNGLTFEAHQSAKSRLPLIIPWHPGETIKLGSTLRSWSQGNPWSMASPFHLDSLNNTPVTVTRENGTNSTYRSQSTSSTSHTKDHMSLGFGMGVGLPFLAEASVTGQYDKEVTENKDANKISVRATTRAGYVAFERQPLLTTKAIITIKYGGGISAFHERYGDYYVAGYRLGGNTGLMLSGSNAARKELEQFGVTLKVKVLFVEKAETWTKDEVISSQSSGLSLSGYDTLSNQYWSLGLGHAGTGTDVKAVQQCAADVISESRTLESRIEDKLDDLNIVDGETLSIEYCDDLIKSGLVVELVLLPVTSLRQVILWLQKDNII